MNKFKGYKLIKKKKTMTPSLNIGCRVGGVTDSRSTIHILNTLQGMRNLRKPVGSEQNVLSSNKVGSHVESIRTCSLVLDNGYVLDLERTFYIPSFSRNLI